MHAPIKNFVRQEFAKQSVDGASLSAMQRVGLIYKWCVAREDLRLAPYVPFARHVSTLLLLLQVTISTLTGSQHQVAAFIENYKIGFPTTYPGQVVRSLWSGQPTLWLSP